MYTRQKITTPQNNYSNFAHKTKKVLNICQRNYSNFVHKKKNYYSGKRLLKFCTAGEKLLSPTFSNFSSHVQNLSNFFGPESNPKTVGGFGRSSKFTNSKFAKLPKTPLGYYWPRTQRGTQPRGRPHGPLPRAAASGGGQARRRSQGGKNLL